MKDNKKKFEISKFNSFTKCSLSDNNISENSTFSNTEEYTVMDTTSLQSLSETCSSNKLINSLFDDTTFKKKKISDKNELFIVFKNCKNILCSFINFITNIINFIYKILSGILNYIIILLKKISTCKLSNKSSCKLSNKSSCKLSNKSDCKSNKDKKSSERNYNNNTSLISEINKIDTDLSKIKNNFITNKKKHIIKKSSSSDLSLSSNDSSSSDLSSDILIMKKKKYNENSIYPKNNTYTFSDPIKKKKNNKNIIKKKYFNKNIFKKITEIKKNNKYKKNTINSSCNGGCKGNTEMMNEIYKILNN